MTHIPASRRTVLRAGAAAGGGLLLALHLPARLLADVPPSAAGAFAPNAFLRIDRQNVITLIAPHTEVGQGIYTSSAMLLAEELDVGLDQITVTPAPPDEKLYRDPELEEQATGGSASTRVDWKRLREAGATARAMLVAAAAARWNVDPSRCTVERGIVHHTGDGRTLPYSALVDDAARLPVPHDVPLKTPPQWRLIGRTQRRLDTPAKVNGTAVFGMDVRVPGMKIGTVAACPVRGGKLAGIDEAAARAVPGVRDVVRLENAVAVVGDHMWAAVKGLEAAAPRWDEGPHAGVQMPDVIRALDAASKENGAVAKSQGDAAQAIAGAAKKLDVIYQLPFFSHAPMEPINTTLHVRPDGADLWVGTQVPVRAQNAVAKHTGLRPDQVQVHNQLMGGAFGRRLDVDSIEQAAEIAKHLPYPVKLIWTREEDIGHDLYRPYYYDRISAGLDAHGKIIGWSHRVTGSSVMARWAPEGMQQGGRLDPDAVTGAADTPYDFPSHHVEYVRAESPGVTTAWWRGVGPTHNVFVVESFMDEMANEAGQDPVAFRRAMLGTNARARRVLDLAAEKSGWGSKLPAGQGRGVALQFAFDTYLAVVLQCEVSDRGAIRIHKVDAAVDCGPVVNPDTVVAQVEGGLIFGLTSALYSEITLKNGRVEQSNFHNYRMMRINEAPDIAVHIVGDGTKPIGGIGETGTAIAAPALANAIFAATGRRLRRIPFGTGQLAGV